MKFILLDYIKESDTVPRELKDLLDKYKDRMIELGVKYLDSVPKSKNHNHRYEKFSMLSIAAFYEFIMPLFYVYEDYEKIKVARNELLLKVRA